MVNTVATKARKSQPKMAQTKDVVMTDAAPLYNPYEGNEGARQLGETISEFTKRLPVLDSTSVGPWIWIANPYTGRSETEPEHHDASFIQLGSRLLKEFMSKKEALIATHPEMAPGTVTRTLKPVRDQLKDDILALAKGHEVTCGKVRRRSQH